MLRRLLTALVFYAAGWAAYQVFGLHAALLLLTILTLALLFQHEKQISRLADWASQPLGTPLPEARGIWMRPFLALHRRARQAASQRKVLAEMVERFRLAAEALPEGVVILDAHQAIEWMNPRAERLLGIDARRDAGMLVCHLMREPEFVDFMKKQPADGKLLVLRPMRSPGSVLHVRATPFSAGRTLLLVEDLTQLDRLESVRRDFIANVSHELRTPLTVVQGFLETASDAIADPDQSVDAVEIHSYLGMALDHARRMQRLVEDLLTLSSLETDAPPQEEVIDVKTLLAMVCEEAEALSGGRHSIELDNCGPARLHGRQRELHSAFSNLVSNAVRYTPAGGTICISWVGGGDLTQVEFAVSDTGIGIEARHIPRLTERFYRVDRGRSREVGGTGLGLAIVKHVLERHQASLNINSTAGKGSCFTARFPVERIAA